MSYESISYCKESFKAFDSTSHYMNVLVLNITAAAEMGVNGTCVLRKSNKFPSFQFFFFMLSKTCLAFIAGKIYVMAEGCLHEMGTPRSKCVTNFVLGVWASHDFDTC